MSSNTPSIAKHSMSTFEKLGKRNNNRFDSFRKTNLPLSHHHSPFTIPTMNIIIIIISSPIKLQSNSRERTLLSPGIPLSYIATSSIIVVECNRDIFIHSGRNKNTRQRLVSFHLMKSVDCILIFIQDDRTHLF